MTSFGKGIRAGVRRLFTPAVPGAVRSRNSLRSEIDVHIDARVRYLIARGVSPEDARRDAIARFGGDLEGALRVLEASAVASERQASLRERAESVGQDVRFVLRGLGRAPTFTAGVVVTMLLGLGINAAVFRVADRVLTRAPAGVADPGALRRIAVLQANGKAAPLESQVISYPIARALADSRAFDRAALYANTRGLQTADGREIAGIYADSGYFRALGVHASVGRFFDASEAEPGANVAVAVASYDYWQREMGAENLTSAAPLRIGDRAYRVIGVAPRGFAGVDLDPVDLWLPFGVAALGRGNINGVDVPWYRLTGIRAIRVIGRLPTGGSAERATAQSGAALPQAAGSFATMFKGVRLSTIHDARDVNGGDASRPLLARLIIVAVVVLIIACANAANLLLARGLRRRRELAVRLALGAGRGRIVRLLVLESVTLGLAGGAAAALAGCWLGDALRRLVFPDARWTTTAFDNRALWFTAIVALLAGLVAGLAPALQLATPDLVSGLKDNRYQPGRRSHRTRAALIVLQTAFSLFLLIASGLLVRSLQRLSDVDLGFQPRGLVTVELPSNRFGLLGSLSAPRVEAAELAKRLEREPSVKGMALSSNAPFGSHASMTISVPGRAEPEIPPGDGPWYAVVSPTFFATMGMRPSSGRLFTAADIQGSQPVAIVNETMARYYWRDADPLASCILTRGMCARVVGVVRDVRDYHSGGAPPPRYYLALAQQEDSATAVVLRTTAEEAPRLARAVKSVVPASQRVTIQLIEDRVDQAMEPWRIAALLFGALGAIALLLSCVGVYSVMSYITSERIPELGIRLVLGATSGGLVALVLKSGLRLVAAGIVTGLAATALGARLLSALLFGVSPFDPVIYVAAAVMLTVIGLLAILIPAVRVVRTDPTVALRAE